MARTSTLSPAGAHMSIDFKNLILGQHESKVLFMWNPENGVMLGAFLGIKDGIETILAREGTTAVQRAILEELRAVADKSDWDFAALRKSLSGSHETRCCGDLCPPN